MAARKIRDKAKKLAAHLLTVEGTIRPEQVISLAAQGFPAGQDGFDALLEALRTDTIYANVHMDRFAGGEIRGQTGPRPQSLSKVGRAS
jgi:hypothetical protein